MPTVYIWYPDKKHPYGHASLQTDKYHISFWPDGDVKDFGIARAASVGVPGCLVFHPELDRFYEEKCRPTATYHIVNATDEAINDIHEKFLRYNEIDPADVTLEKAVNLIDDEEGPQKPQVSVPKTRYTFKPKFEGQVGLNVVLDAILPSEPPLIEDVNAPFYHLNQSCVSLCFNIIERADRNPQGISSKVLDNFTLQMFDNTTVPWFESHIKRHWVNESPSFASKILDNSIIRILRYWILDAWTSNSRIGQVKGFRNFPVDFQTKNKNKGKGG